MEKGMNLEKSKEGYMGGGKEEMIYLLCYKNKRKKKNYSITKEYNVKSEQHGSEQSWQKEVRRGFAEIWASFNDFRIRASRAPGVADSLLLILSEELTGLRAEHGVRGGFLPSIRQVRAFDGLWTQRQAGRNRQLPSQGSSSRSQMWLLQTQHSTVLTVMVLTLVWGRRT